MSTPDEQQPPPTPVTQKRRPLIEPSWSWGPGFALVVFTAIAVYVGWMFLDRAGEPGGLTQLEQAFFGLYTLFMGAGISWATTHIYAHRDTKQRFEQLARPALRRVVAARESAEGLLVAVGRRQRDGSNPEALASLIELVEQHARTLDDAISDWHELLPAEVAQAHQQRQQGARDRLDGQLAELGVRLEAIEAAQPGPAGPDPEIAHLKSEVDRLRREVTTQRPSGAIIASNGDGTYSSILRTLDESERPSFPWRLVEAPKRTQKGSGEKKGQ